MQTTVVSAENNGSKIGRAYHTDLPPIASELDILGHLDLCRSEVARRLDQESRSKLGQFITPAPVARLMASMFSISVGDKISLLDPGAGIGTLAGACVESFCIAEPKPSKITITAYEIEPLFLRYLEDTLNLCRAICEKQGIAFDAVVIPKDFVDAGTSILQRNLLSPPSDRFTHAILNPPYHKIKTDSSFRKMLRTCGIETSNLYTAFLALTSMLLVDNGQMVSITPRSFCNGLYFKPFRKQFLGTMNIERLHLFQSRTEAFHEDAILQENLVMSARKRSAAPSTVVISSSFGVDDDLINVREVEPCEIVSGEDPESIIHIVTDDLESRIAKLAARFSFTLDELGLSVSTGRVVDFRAEEFIVGDPQPGAAPLIYPAHFDQGYVRWPLRGTKKSNAIMVTSETTDQLLPSQNYVLVKRFSAKEEPKRIAAAVYDSSRIQATSVGFENHLNYFHSNHAGLNLTVAKGLAAFLNSTFVDTLFRHFSGHTQVNAVDLRRLRYPSLNQLEALGRYIGQNFPDQDELDHIIQQELLGMAESDLNDNPMSAKGKINEALSALKALGFPRAQQNERSALTLLALLNLKPSSRWSEAANPLCGITPMMEFFSQHYGKNYKPNTRETVRRQTIHQFLAAGLIVENPDEPARPVNSPRAVYQIERGALELLRAFGTPEWNSNLGTYLASRLTLIQRYAREREMKRIPIQVGNNRTITLSPGGQNILVEQIIKEFAERFTPGGRLVYIGDTDEKFAFFEEDTLKSLGVQIETHGKMPDVIIEVDPKIQTGG